MFSTIHLHTISSSSVPLPSSPLTSTIYTRLHDSLSLSLQSSYALLYLLHYSHRPSRPNRLSVIYTFYYYSSSLHTVLLYCSQTSLHYQFTNSLLFYYFLCTSFQNSFLTSSSLLPTSTIILFNLLHTSLSPLIFPNSPVISDYQLMYVLSTFSFSLQRHYVFQIASSSSSSSIPLRHSPSPPLHLFTMYLLYRCVHASNVLFFVPSHATASTSLTTILYFSTICCVTAYVVDSQFRMQFSISSQHRFQLSSHYILRCLASNDLTTPNLHTICVTPIGCVCTFSSVHTAPHTSSHFSNYFPSAVYSMHSCTHSISLVYLSVMVSSHRCMLACSISI
uniref:Uncharacterized protein n=1 Tax=Lygus hesperus TaxID=30085 RepID=A0A0A9WX12_LYGHE